MATKQPRAERRQQIRDLNASLEALTRDHHNAKAGAALANERYNAAIRARAGTDPRDKHAEGLAGRAVIDAEEAVRVTENLAVAAEAEAARVVQQIAHLRAIGAANLARNQKRPDMNVR